MDKNLKYLLFLIIFIFSIKLSTGKYYPQNLKSEKYINVYLKVKGSNLGTHYVIKFSEKNDKRNFKVISKKYDVPI